MRCTAAPGARLTLRYICAITDLIQEEIRHCQRGGGRYAHVADNPCTGLFLCSGSLLWLVLACGGWVNTPDYLAAKRALTEEIKLAFDEAGVEIPFPQVDVHMKQE